MADLLAESGPFRDLDRTFIDLLAGCAKNVHFKAGDHIFREGEDSNRFYVLRAGRVAIEMGVAGRGPMIIETLQEGDLLSWSWLVPPFKKQFDARALEVTRAIELDGECLRRKCEEDQVFGYQILKRIALVIGQRLAAARLQLMDFYGQNG